MAKKNQSKRKSKPKPKYRLRYIKKTLTTRDKDKVSVSRKRVVFKTPVKIRSKKEAKKFFEKEITKHVKRLHKRHPRRKLRYGFKGTKRFKGKTIQTGWGVSRFKRRDIKGQIESASKKFAKDMDKYLKRKDCQFIAIKYIELEVVDATRAYAPKKRRGKKKR